MQIYRSGRDPWTMITLGETLLGTILGISTTGPQIYGENFATLNWNKSEAPSVLFGVRVNEVAGIKNSFLINCLTP